MPTFIDKFLKCAFDKKLEKELATIPSANFADKYYFDEASKTYKLKETYTEDKISAITQELEYLSYQGYVSGDTDFTIQSIERTDKKLMNTISIKLRTDDSYNPQIWELLAFQGETLIYMDVNSKIKLIGSAAGYYYYASEISFPATSKLQLTMLYATAPKTCAYRIDFFFRASSNQSNIIINTNPLLDHSYNGIVATMTAGENLSYGYFCYFKSDGKLWKSDANTATTMPIVAMALTTIAANGSGLFLLYGIARDDSWAWNVGGLLYASAAATGALVQTQPAGVGDQIQVAGYAISADIIFFNPNYEMVEL